MSNQADERVVSLLRRLSEASSVPEEVVLEQALKLWAAERELDAEAPHQTEERSCAIALPLGSSEVWAYLPAYLMALTFTSCKATANADGIPCFERRFVNSQRPFRNDDRQRLGR